MPAVLKIGKKLCAGCKSYFSCLECAWQRMMWYGGGGGWPWSPSLPLSHRYKLPPPSPQKSFNLHWREAEANLRSNEVITELPRLRMWSAKNNIILSINTDPGTLSQHWTAHSGKVEIAMRIYESSPTQPLWTPFPLVFFHVVCLVRRKIGVNLGSNFWSHPDFLFFTQCISDIGGELDNDCPHLVSLVLLDEHAHFRECGHPRPGEHGAWCVLDHVQPAGHVRLSIWDQTWGWQEQQTCYALLSWFLASSVGHIKGNSKVNITFTFSSIQRKSMFTVQF